MKKRITSGAWKHGKGLEYIFVSSSLNELVNRLNLLYQDKKAGNETKFGNAETIAIVEYDCLTKENYANILSFANI